MNYIAELFYIPKLSSMQKLRLVNKVSKLGIWSQIWVPALSKTLIVKAMRINEFTQERGLRVKST
jgi:hypothetical protein